VSVDQLTGLLLAAQRGDERALEQFIRATQADVWRLCRHLGDPDVADDLAQETYERAIGSLHRYRADGPATSWLFTIARRTCADSARRRGRRRRHQARTEHELTDDPATIPIDQVRVELDDLLARLDPDRRAAFVVTQVLGLRYEEAADVLGCPVGTIRSRVARARADLLAMVRPATSDESAPTGTEPRRAATDHA
jgi:RNA polymerase sigma-70 factor, ECF subfamily